MSSMRSRISDHDWGRMEMMADGQSAHGLEVSLGRMNIRPSGRSPCHVHDNCHEVMTCLSGEVDVLIGDRPIALQAGESLVVAPGTAHALENRSQQEAQVMIAWSSGARHYRETGRAD